MAVWIVTMMGVMLVLSVAYNHWQLSQRERAAGEIRLLRDDRDWWRGQADQLLDKYREQRLRAEVAEEALRQWEGKMEDTSDTERAKWEGSR